MGIPDRWNALRGWEQAALALSVACAVVVVASVSVRPVSKVIGPHE
jgi:hypothetical protein